MQVYAIVHDGENCLIFKKRICGYFFKRKVAVETILNGAGACCFPGGRLEEGESPVIGALREFKEETGVDIGVPKNFEIKRELYTGVFFRVSLSELDDIKAKCSMNLVIAENMVGQIKNVPYRIGRELLDIRLPSDNELEAKVDKVSIAKTLFTKDDEKTGWFYELIESYLKNPH